MATYAIGDIQGCYASLKALLTEVNFGAKDQLWLTGDLVNRGPSSLEVLRFIADLGDQARTVLGNHDLHLLAIHHGTTSFSPGRTLLPILNAADCDSLMRWLQHQPLLIDDANLHCVMTHAGIPHIWDLSQASALAKEVESTLQSNHYRTYFEHMYGNEPACWSDQLCGYDRLRTITNYFTRMRFIADDGRLDFKANGGLDSQPENFAPWFTQVRPKTLNRRIITGHWAALGLYQDSQVSSIDTGCVWGNNLTARRLEDGAIFSVQNQDKHIQER